MTKGMLQGLPNVPVSTSGAAFHIQVNGQIIKNNLILNLHVLF